MNTEELFVDINNLPRLLSKDEQKKLFQEFNGGSEQAKQELIKHNICLVLREVSHRFQLVNYEKKELVSVGIMGLINAVNTFDINLGFEFSTYAIKCIDNEILAFLKKMKRNLSLLYSIDSSVIRKKDGSKVKLKDMLSDDTNLKEEVERVEVQKIVRKSLLQLPARDREIMMLYFGFYNDKIYSQRQIAHFFKLSPSSVSRIISKNLNDIGQNLHDMGIINLPVNLKNNEKFKSRNAKPINFSNLKTPLLEEEQILIDMWNHFQLCSMELSNNKRKNEKIEFTAEYYLDILKLLRQPKFKEYLKMFTIKEAVILLLKLDYIEDVQFTEDSIASFFKLSIVEMRILTRNSLIKYKANIDKIIKNSFSRVTSSDKYGQKNV